MRYRVRSKRYAFVAASAMTMALTGGLAVVSVAPASAGGWTAVPAQTISFAGGTYSAQFVRSASGIVNETNRVQTPPTVPGNGYGPFDVWIQFRPTNAPAGAKLTANPACDSNIVVPWWNTTITDSALTGYFVNGVNYNVCVYYAHNFALTMLANGSTSGTFYEGEHVTYSGVETYGGVPVGANFPVTLTVWSGFNCPANPPLGTFALMTDSNGVFTLDAGNAGTGEFSVQASADQPLATHIVSPCLNINELPDLTLTANGLANLTVPSGTGITYAGTLSYNGGGSVSGQSVDMNIFTAADCTGTQVGIFPVTVATTNGSGDYTWSGPDTVATTPGTYYLMTDVGGLSGILSNCITVTVTP